jgi:hypothetical protein
MSYYDIANVVTIKKTNMIRQNALWLCNNHCCDITAPRLPQYYVVFSPATDDSSRAAQRSQLLSKSPADLRRSPSSSKLWLSYRSDPVSP